MHSKYCEWCGKNSITFIYRFLARVDYVIHLDSPHVRTIDEQNQDVILSDGQRISYSAKLSPVAATSFRQLIPHIFCSEQCEDSFLEKYQGFFRNDIPELTPLSKFNDSQFLPVSFPVSNVKHTTATCKQCGVSFPNVSKTFNVFRITASAIEEGTLTSQPLTGNSYQMAFSDMHPSRPTGRWYFLTADLKSPSKELFCSNDCSYDFAKTHNVLVVFQNVLMENNLTALSPFTLDINRGLSNPNIFRPQVLRR
jgi:hypothetical protein